MQGGGTPAVQSMLGNPMATFRVGCVLVFGLVFLAFSLLWVVSAWSLRAPWFFILFGVPFVVIGLGMVGWALWRGFIRSALVGRYLGPAELVISKDMLRIGEAFRVQYRQSTRREVEIKQVTVDLVLVEAAHYRRGTDDYTVTHHHVAQEFRSGGRRLYARDEIVEDHQMRIPRAAMHGFESKNNRLQWIVRVRVEPSGSPDAVEVREIMVLPALAARDDDG